MPAIHEARDRRQLRRDEEGGHGGHQQVDQEDERHVAADEQEQDDPAGTKEIRRQHDQAGIAAFDEHSRDRAEGDRRHEEGQDQDRVGRVRPGCQGHGAHQARQHHVARQLAEDLCHP